MKTYEKLLLVMVCVGVGVLLGRFLFSYTNREEWEIIRDKDGRVRGVRVHRVARG